MTSNIFTFPDTLKVKLTDLPTTSDTLIVKHTQIANEMTKLEYFNENIIPILTLIFLFSAFIVSLCVYIHTRNHNRRALKQSRAHNELSLEYRLIFRANTNHRLGKIKLWIGNKGLGPCLFDNFEMEYDSKIYYSMINVFKAINSKPEFNFTDKDFNMDYRLFTAPLNNYAITPNENKTLIKYQLVNKNKDTITKYYKEYKKIIFRYQTSDFYKKSQQGEFLYSKNYDIKDEGHIE